MWRIGALSKPLRDHMVVDTGAMGNLMVIREEQWFNHTRPELIHLGTADMGRTLVVTAVGTAGLWEEVLFAPSLAFGVPGIEDSTEGLCLH